MMELSSQRWHNCKLHIPIDKKGRRKFLDISNTHWDMTCLKILDFPAFLHERYKHFPKKTPSIWLPPKWQLTISIEHKDFILSPIKRVWKYDVLENIGYISFSTGRIWAFPPKNTSNGLLCISFSTWGIWVLLSRNTFHLVVFQVRRLTGTPRSS